MSKVTKLNVSMISICLASTGSKYLGFNASSDLVYRAGRVPLLKFLMLLLFCIYKRKDTIMNIMNPRAIDIMELVILFLIM